MARQKIPGNPKPKKFVEELEVKLKGIEVEEKREQLEELQIKLADIEAKKSALVKPLTDEKKKLTIERDQVLASLKSKSEKRMVECVETYNFDNNRAIVTRTDTDEIVRERAIDGDERSRLAQGELPVELPRKPQNDIEEPRA